MDDIVTQLHEYITTPSSFVIVAIAVISAIYIFASIASMYTASIVRQEDDDYHSGSACLGVGIGVLNETEQSDVCNEKLLKELTGSNEPSFMPYEGSGFLLHYKDKVILGIRNKKKSVFLKDPTLEMEYMGGKIEEEDNNDPLTTAYNELVEEVGDVILNDTWRERVVTIHTFQEASQKWIWCNLLELTTDEYQRLKLFDSVHDQWENSKERDFSSITNRSELSRKAVLGFVEVDSKDIVKYVREFSYIDSHSPSNSMSFSERSKAAKDYRKGNVLYAHRLYNHQDEYQLPLRAFNTVIFEQHFETIKNRIFKKN